MARTMKLSDFFGVDLNENYQRAAELVRPEELKAFSERETGVRKDHFHGRPNSSPFADADKSLRAAEGFLVSHDTEVHFFFNKFRRLIRLYKELKTK